MNAQNTTPLGKVASGLLVLLAALAEPIETLGGALVVAAGEWDGSLVDLFFVESD